MTLVRHARPVGLALLGVLLLAAPGTAQTLRGSAMGFMAQRRVSFQGTVDEQTGTWFGLEGSLGLGKLSLGAGGLFGSLAGATDPLTMPDLRVRVSNVWLGVHAAPWLDLAAVVEARRYEADVGVTSWRLIGPQLRLTPSLGAAGLNATAELTYFASASVVGGGEKLSPAIRAVVGVTLAPPRGPVQFRLSYRFERFDFGAVGTSPARLEQFSGIQAGLAVQLGRR